VPPEHPGLAALADLERAGAISLTGLTLTREIPFEQYEALLRMVGGIHRLTSWVIGDLINYGERVFGETYAQAADALGLAEQTVMNIASVCRRVPPHLRRPDLPFTVHAEVASLPVNEQQRWLKKAEQSDWTRSRMREELQAMRADAAGETVVLPPPTPTLSEAAHAVVRRARQAGDPAWYMVPREAIVQLRVACGE
jgi:hypothetical protein